MTTEDWGDMDYCGDELYDHDGVPVHCKKCQSADVYWEAGRGKHNRKIWILKDTGTLQRHECNSFGDIEPI